MAYKASLVSDSELPRFIDYLADHLTDNNDGKTPLFQPMSREEIWPRGERLISFREQLGIPVGIGRWRRLWKATTEDGDVVGHFDLHARSEPFTLHRARVGIGVHREHGRRGIARLLLDTALEWASGTQLEWIDIDVLEGNHPAVTLYEAAGFHRTGFVADLFRIDGRAIGNFTMTKQLRVEGTGKKPAQRVKFNCDAR